MLEWLLVAFAAVWLVQTGRSDYGSTTVRLSLRKCKTIRNINSDVATCRVNSKMAPKLTGYGKKTVVHDI